MGALARILPLCLLVAASAATAVEGPAVGGIAVSTVAGGNGLGVVVRSTGAEGRMSLVVAHDDPVSGTVVDRVVPFSTPASGSVEIRLAGLPAGHGFKVRVIANDVPIPTVSNDSLIPDGLLVEDLPVLARVDAPPLPAPLRGGVEHRFRGYPVTDDPDFGGLARLFSTPSGLVVVAGHGVRSTAGPVAEFPLLAFVSRDGGRTFGPAIEISASVGNSVLSWSGAVDSRGFVAFFYQEVRQDGWDTVPVGALRYARLDPAAGAVASRGDLAPNLRFNGAHAAAALPDGALLFAGREPARDGGEPETGIEVWRVNADDSVALLQKIPAASTLGVALPLVLATSPAGAAGLVCLAGERGDVAYSLSPVGADAFSDPAPIEELTRLTVHRAPTSARLDASGTLHVAVRGGHPGRWLNDTHGNHHLDNVTMYYVRVPPAGTGPVVRTVNGPYADAIAPGSLMAEDPLLEVRGPRMWLVWNNFAWADPERAATGRVGPTYGVESVDGGFTFGAPYRATAVEGHPIPTLHDLALLPDGRPVLLAWYRHSDGRSLRSTVPLFDPLAPPGSGLTDVRVLEEAPSRKEEPARVDPVGATPTTTTATPPEGPASEPTMVPAPAPLLALAAAALVLALRRRR
jgi:MYXO-CTERM domain-containing protein